MLQWFSASLRFLTELGLWTMTQRFATLAPAVCGDPAPFYASFDSYCLIVMHVWKKSLQNVTF